MSYNMYKKSKNVTYKVISPFRTVVFLRSLHSVHIVLSLLSAYSSHLFVYTVIVCIDSY